MGVVCLIQRAVQCAVFSRVASWGGAIRLAAPPRSKLSVRCHGEAAVVVAVGVAQPPHAAYPCHHLSQIQNCKCAAAAAAAWAPVQAWAWEYIRCLRHLRHVAAVEKGTRASRPRVFCSRFGRTCSSIMGSWSA